MMKPSCYVWSPSPPFVSYLLCLSEASSPEWIGFQEADYKFFDHRTTWEQAQRICSWFDSSLASVHSAEEEAFLANTLRKVMHTSGKKKFILIWRSSFSDEKVVQ